MSIQLLSSMAGKILATASSLQYNPGSMLESPSPDDQVRESNEGIERLMACAAGYAYPLPPQPVTSPKLWFGEQYGECLSTFVSLLGEHRILNTELIAIGAQGAWLYRYATAYDLTLLASFSQLTGSRVAGLNDITDYCRERDIINAPMVLLAVQQLGKMIGDFHAVLSKDTADA